MVLGAVDAIDNRASITLCVCVSVTVTTFSMHTN